jgi:hypothetical protein
MLHAQQTVSSIFYGFNTACRSTLHILSQYQWDESGWAIIEPPAAKIAAINDRSNLFDYTA